MIAPVVIGQRRLGDDAVALDLAVPADHPAFAGHFPDRPILPGVVQIDWALRLAEQHLGSGAVTSRDFQVKFRRVIAPGAPVVVELRLDRAGPTLAFTYRQDDDIASTGRLRLDPAP